MSTRLKVFLVLMTAIAVVGVGAWFGCQAWSWPKRTLANGWTIKVHRSWDIPDVTEIPEQSRPLLFARPTATDEVNRLTILPQNLPAETREQFLREMSTMYGLEQPGSTLSGQGYLRTKDTNLPYVLFKGTKQHLLAVMAKRGEVTYYLFARYTDEEEDFGKQVITALRSLR